MRRTVAVLALIVGVGFSATPPAEAGRYSVACIAPSGPWCRIACTSNRAVACNANVVNGRCRKFCQYN